MPGSDDPGHKKALGEGLRGDRGKDGKRAGAEERETCYPPVGGYLEITVPATLSCQRREKLGQQQGLPLPRRQVLGFARNQLSICVIHLYGDVGWDITRIQ